MDQLAKRMKEKRNKRLKKEFKEDEDDNVAGIDDNYDGFKGAEEEKPVVEEDKMMNSTFMSGFKDINIAVVPDSDEENYF
mmetsp:Transcript_20809/g.32110  ORF Transcript_20809/g.32110 Transcript_20809/m.32110 type:complete len:80 (+) Transcript_20809:1527-1766(+)